MKTPFLTKEKAEETVSNDINSNEYASNKIKFAIFL